MYRSAPEHGAGQVLRPRLACALCPSWSGGVLFQLMIPAGEAPRRAGAPRSVFAWGGIAAPQTALFDIIPQAAGKVYLFSARFFNFVALCQMLLT